jgi:hypothetical protein
MRALVCAAALYLACLAGAALASPPGREGDPGLVPGSATISLSSERVGARPVAITVTLETELQCGRIMSGPVSIRLPLRAQVPSSVASSAVLVGGKPAGDVTVGGHTVTIEIARPKGMICNVIAVGTAKIVITRAANFGNPRLPGRYAVVVRQGDEMVHATLTVR